MKALQEILFNVLHSSTVSSARYRRLTAAEYGLDLGTPCFNPAENSFEVASGFDAIARCTAEAAAPPAVPATATSEEPAFAMMSGRDEKYLDVSRHDRTRSIGGYRF